MIVTIEIVITKGRVHSVVYDTTIDMWLTSLNTILMFKSYYNPIEHGQFYLEQPYKSHIFNS